MQVEKQQLLLVDKNDKFTGLYAEKSLCHKGKGLRHRAFALVLFNKKGEVLLQKRKHQLWDKYWDISAASHLLHFPTGDETYKQAAARCLKRELGIKVKDLEQVGGFAYYAKEKNYCENEYCAIMTGTHNGKVVINPSCVYEYKWVKAKIFYINAIKNKTSYTPWASETVKILQNYAL